MTTVTEAAKRLGIDLHPLEQATGESLKRDPVLAQQFARRLALAAKEIVPAGNFSIEELRDILEVAVLGAASEPVRVVEGRYLRKRVREQVAYSERYGEPFALAVLQLAPEPAEGAYRTAVDIIAGRLRRSDMIAIYKRRVAFLLPRMHPAALAALTDRIRGAFDASVPRPPELATVIESAPAMMFPDAAYADTQAVLDWLEDQLRADGPI